MTHTSAPVRDTTLQQEIWNQLLDAERIVRYYGMLLKRYALGRWILRGVMIAAAVAGVLMLSWPNLPEVAVWIISGVLLSVTIWDAAVDYGEKAALISTVVLESNYLLDAQRKLWLEANKEDADEEDMGKKHYLICDKLTETTAWPMRINIVMNDKLNEKATIEADGEMESRYCAV